MGVFLIAIAVGGCTNTNRCRTIVIVHGITVFCPTLTFLVARQLVCSSFAIWVTVVRINIDVHSALIPFGTKFRVDEVVG